MQEEAWLSFSERVSCEGHYHLDCSSLADTPSAAQALGLAERNAATLATVAALEERRADNADDDDPVFQELLRLDAKLTALVDMVNRMMLPDGELPPRQPIRFNAIGAVLPVASVPASENVLLRLRFDVCRSVPLELPGVVARQFDDGHVFVAFQSLGESVAASLERLVFRQHRRKVAVARQSAS